MADLGDPDVGTVFYRTNDPIENLKIKVDLKRVTTAAIVPPTGPQQDGTVELQDMQSAYPQIYEPESLVVEWQQKVFSQKEIETYRHDNPDFNVIERKYHEEITILLKNETPTNRLFTYVDHDSFSYMDSLYMTTSPKEKPSHLAVKLSEVRQRRFGGRQKREREYSNIPKSNVIEPKPSKEFLLKNHLVPPPLQVMYIMADLSPKGSPPSPDNEYVLCEIVLQAPGVLSINPDFNCGRVPYIVETTSHSNDCGGEIFEYTIDHKSKRQNSQEKDKEVKMYREVYNRHKDFLQACIGHDFEIPMPNVLRLVVYGEIESTKGFESESLYLNFFVDLPKHWYVGSHQQMAWVTQTCYTKIEDNEDVAHFSYPFSFELFYRNDSVRDDNKEDMPHFPVIMIEVLSLDSWNRFCTEGYTYMQIPTKPGVSKHTINCWRPVGNSVVDRLRRFFIGGSPELEDPTYTFVPSTFEGSNLSRFGFRTESTGTVSLRLNVLMQSRQFLEMKVNKRNVGNLLENMGITAMNVNIGNVLEAFKKARLKMLGAREEASKALLKDGVEAES
ncbi:Meckel syndrome type 1 protein-like [Gigantopelta aegis]|uniref:Meckel syndrome type 1 protein-like n=1 Tax=Gigantopelta aegis TaxID=1735272 RepID=UPI001B88D077|nr:Meckel syndrome type 1 protein-like [Gigantopelta aegis]